MEGLLKKAASLATLKKGKIALTEPEVVKKEIREQTELADAEDEVRQLSETSKSMKGEGIISRSVSCTDMLLEKRFYSSIGSEIIQRLGFTYLSCLCVAKEGTKIQRGSERTWSRSGFGKMKFLETGREAKDKALRMLKAAHHQRGDSASSWTLR